MKKYTLFIIMTLLPLWSVAQETNDSRYLEGAVPEVDGKVFFSKSFQIVGMSKDEIMQRTGVWMEDLLKGYKNDSRIVLTDEEKGNIVGNVDHYIVFSNAGLALDRTRMLFLLTATAQPENLKLDIHRIRYVYNETGKEETFPAEEMISDEYALNKSHTKLVRGVAKFRRKTVDYVDSLFVGVMDALAGKDKNKEMERVRNLQDNATVVIGGNDTPTSQPVVDVVKADTPQPKTADVPEGFKEADINNLSADLIAAANGRLVITVGSDIYNMTTLTANAGGSLGKLQGNPVVHTIFGAEQDTSAVMKADTYSVRFYPTGADKPSLILECQKLPTQPSIEGMPQIFTGEIIRAFISK